MVKRGSSARFQVGLLSLFVLGILGCASAGKGNLRDLAAEIARRLELAGLQGVEIEIPFEPTEEMRRWVRKHVGLAGDPVQKLERLLQVLLNRDGKQLEYERSSTRTAREVWVAYRANCLSFSHLLIGLAREVGISAYYLRVGDVERFTREQDLVVASEHVTAAFGPPSQRRILEFSDRPTRTYRDLEPLSDLTAVALHYSNRGADALRVGDPLRARQELRIAVAIDPELADAWVNLGVAERRLGNLEAAESSYRRALQVDPRQSSAYHNLIVLLELTARQAEADELRQLLARGMTRNPYSYIALGDWFRSAKRLAEAEEFYRRATRFDPPPAEGYAALGELALLRRDLKSARKWLKRAERVEAEAPRVVALRARIEAADEHRATESGSRRGAPPQRPQPPLPSRGSASELQDCASGSGPRGAPAAREAEGLARSFPSRR